MILRKIICSIFRKRFRSCGLNPIFFISNSRFSFQKIKLGDHVYIGPKAYIGATHCDVKIEDEVIIGPNLSIFAGNHKFNTVGESLRFAKKSHSHKDKGITIEREVWIGGNVTILDGVTIGKGSVIGAGSVVTKNIPSYSIAAGNPCKVVKSRFSVEEINIHEDTLKIKDKNKYT